VHTSKFSALMSLKVVVCIVSDFVENVFSVMDVIFFSSASFGCPLSQAVLTHSCEK
jgi:hypothetical protein